MVKIIFFLLVFLFGCSQAQLRKPETKPQKTPEQIRLEERQFHFSSTYFLMAEAAMQQVELDQAIQFYLFADRENPDNIIIKETLLELLSYLAEQEEHFNELIKEFSETFFPNGTYNSAILIYSARAYGKTGEYDKMATLMEKAVELDPNMKNYVIFFHMKLGFFEIKDLPLLQKALEYEWQDENYINSIAWNLCESQPELAIEILQKQYQKTKTESAITALAEMYEFDNQFEKATDLLKTHIRDYPEEASDELKSYFITMLFRQFKFDEIMEWKELCFELNSARILKILFVISMAKEQYPLAMETGKAIEKTLEFDAEIESSFYSHFAHTFFHLGDDENFLAYSLKIKELAHILELYVALSRHTQEAVEERERFYELMEVNSKESDEKEMFQAAAGLIYGVDRKVDKMMAAFAEVSDEFLMKEELLDVMIVAHLENYQNITKAKELMILIDNETSPDEMIFFFLYNLEDKETAIEIAMQELNSQEKPSASSFQVAGRIFEEQDKLDIMFQYLEEGVKLYPEDPMMLNHLGYSIALYGRKEDYERAEMVLQKALELMPDSVAITDSLSWLYYKQGRYELAKQVMENFTMEQIEYSEIAYHLGKIYWKLNQNKEALTFFQKAINLDNDEKFVELSEQYIIKINQ